MATTVYTTEDIVLQDGSEITLRRLNIKGQRKFMNMFENLPTATTNDEGIDQLLDMAEICLTPIDEELAQDRDKLEEVLDEQTIFKIIEVCAGLKLNDPNLIAMAAAAMANQEEVGQN